LEEEVMKEELSWKWEESEQRDAGEGSLERSGSEPSPAARPGEWGPPADAVQEREPPSDGDGDEAPALQSVEASASATPPPAPDEGEDLSDEQWEDAWPPAAKDGQQGWHEAPCGDEEPPTPAPNLGARRRGVLSKPKRAQMPLSPQQKLLLLDSWQRSGLPARDFAALVQLSHHTLHAWKRRFEELGPGGLTDQPRGVRAGSRLPELTKRTILMLKAAHPDWGCQRISDMLVRGPALPASPSAVARVLHEAGYEMDERATRPHPPQVRSFERAKPNQLWQTDLFTFVLKRQNCRVHLVAFMDDHSRFITGYGLHASQSASLVLEVLRAAIAAYGLPAEILTDNGSQYVTWRGKSQFTRELEKRGVKQIVARPRRPQTLGKIERFWGSLWRECVETAVFLDLADARRRIGLWIDYYNLQRPHQGIEGLVPADRFFSAAPEVLQTLKQRVAENARQLARTGVPKKPFYLTGQVEGQPFSVHREGDRVVLQRGDRPREEIDLKPTDQGRAGNPPRREPPDELPPSICPDGSPLSLWQHRSRELAPGVSPLDDIVEPGQPSEGKTEAADEPREQSPEEGGAR
jgi:transposase InsO family protein